MIAAIINVLFFLGIVYYILDNSERIKDLEKTVKRQETLISKLNNPR